MSIVSVEHLKTKLNSFAGMELVGQWDNTKYYGQVCDQILKWESEVKPAVLVDKHH